MRTPTPIQQHAISIYFILAFGISWGFVLVLTGPANIPIDPGESADLLPFLYVSMLFGPAIGGILMTSLVGGKAAWKELFARLVKWRVNIRWYAAALLLAPVLAILVLLLLSLYAPEYQPALLHADDAPELILGGLAAAIMVGFFEEIGWTGFAIPRLLERYSILTTGLIAGLLWGAWHFILFWEADSFLGWLPFSILVTRLFTWLPPFRVLMVWIYDSTGSLLLVMLTHMSLVFATTVIVPMTLTGMSLLIWLLSWSAVLWIAAGVVVWAEKGRLTRKPLRA